MEFPYKITILGFMGSGKSTMGKKIAKKIGYQFIDLDKQIELQQNKTISEFFLQSGEDEFRKIEKKVLEEILLKNDKMVISLGGGTPCFYSNMVFINQYSFSIYLKYEAGILCSRLKSGITNRPLIFNKNDEELLKYIKNTLQVREKFYSQSKLIIEAKQCSDNLVINQLKQVLAHTPHL